MTGEDAAAYAFRSATPADAGRVRALVHAAYGHYVERLGMEPRPMLDHYDGVIARHRVTLAEAGSTVAGVVVLGIDDEGFLVDNVAVDPAHRGRGLGKRLLELAESEARRAGFDSVYLYTHERMTENLALYAHLGYAEYDRRCMGDFSLVYLRKPLT